MSTFYPYRGGIAQFNANLYDELSREHTVKAFNFTCQYPSVLFPGKTQYVTPQDEAKPTENERVLNSANPLSYLRAARRIAAWKPDLVVMRYWMTYFAPSLGTVARILRRRGIKVIAILDNVVPHEPKFYDRPFSRWFLRQCDGCIALSKSVLEDMLSLKVNLPHTLLFHPLYNHFGPLLPKEQAQKSLGLDTGLRTLLFFGLIRDYKGLDLLLEAFPALGEEYQLVIAGESYGGFEKYQKMMDAGGCEGRIKVFNRYIDDSQVPEFFSAADLCVLPYKTATQSGITAVALHFGLPVAATRTGGLEETIEKPGIGVMADEISAEGIRRAVEKFFADGPQKYRDSIAMHKKSIGWDVFASKLTDFYKTL